MDEDDEEQRFDSFSFEAGIIKTLSSDEKILLINYFSSSASFIIKSEVQISEEHNLNHTRVQTIFYTEYEHEKQEICRRHWLVYKNNKFYCVMCLCFGIELDSTSANVNQFINGLSYEHPFHRFIQKIRRHEDLQYHTASEKQYLAFRKYEESEAAGGDIKDSRKVVEIVIKIIIFLATHSKYIALHSFIMSRFRFSKKKTEVESSMHSNCFVLFF